MKEEIIIPGCEICGCEGNQSCGHDPANKDKGCALDSQLICYCCREKYKKNSNNKIEFEHKDRTTGKLKVKCPHNKKNTFDEIVYVYSLFCTKCPSFKCGNYEEKFIICNE